MKKESEKIVQADTESGQRLGELIVEVAENQVKENNPPETKETLERLIALGESRENAMRYIASVLSIEIYDIVKEEIPFNEKRYINNLHKLPILPEGMSHK